MNFKTRSTTYTITLDEMVGACCSSTDCNENVSVRECLEVTGNRFFHNQTCIGARCFSEPYGACCKTQGQCTEELKSVCDGAGGSFKGDGVQCVEYDCCADDSTANQACCTNGVCTDEKPCRCTEGGGTPQGTGTVCDANTCVVRVEGACCKNGSCTNVSATGCTGEPGTDTWIFQAGVSCDAHPNKNEYPCTFATGACCFGPLGYNGEGITFCVDGYTSGQCLSPIGGGGSGGKSWSVDTLCSALGSSGDCVAPVPEETYACCVPNRVDLNLVLGQTPYVGEYLEDYTVSDETEDYCINTLGGRSSGPSGTNTLLKASELGAGGCCSEHSAEETCISDIIGGCLILFTGVPGKDIECTPEGETETLLSCHDRYTVAVDNLQGAEGPITGGFSEGGIESDSILSPLCGYSEFQDFYSMCIWNFDAADGIYKYVGCVETEQTLGSPPPDVDKMIEVAVNQSLITNCVDEASCNETGYLFSKVKDVLCLNDDCTDPTDPNSYIGACCTNSNANCNTVVSTQNCDGAFYINEQCESPDCNTPCCTSETQNVIACANNSGFSRPVRQQRPSCYDRFSFNQTTFDEETVIATLTSSASITDPYILDDNLSLYSSNSNCEECNGPCTNNRGTCCWRGRSIYNITQEECITYGGVFQGCEGQPFSTTTPTDNVAGPSSYDFDNTACSGYTEYTSSASSLPEIEIIHSVAIPSTTNLGTRLRRGLFANNISGTQSLINATDDNYESLSWLNGGKLRSTDNDQLEVENFTKYIFPGEVNAVQIFWSPTKE